MSSPSYEVNILEFHRREMLTVEQHWILDAVKNNQNVFFSGAAGEFQRSNMSVLTDSLCVGTGKSYLLSQIISCLPRETTFITAPTGKCNPNTTKPLSLTFAIIFLLPSLPGIAAVNIGGCTVHSFSGLGVGDCSLPEAVSKATRNSSGNRWRQAKVLIIDEVMQIDFVALFFLLICFGRFQCLMAISSIVLNLVIDLLHFNPFSTFPIHISCTCCARQRQTIWGHSTDCFRRFSSGSQSFTS